MGHREPNGGPGLICLRGLFLTKLHITFNGYVNYYIYIITILTNYEILINDLSYNSRIIIKSISQLLSISYFLKAHLFHIVFITPNKNLGSC